MKKHRVLYLALILICIIAGISIRKYGVYLPYFVASYFPDALWAAMVYCLIAAVFYKPPVVSGIAALAFSCVIEASQLYHAPLIDSIRATTIGHLVLGEGFLWSDIICYTVGIIIFMILDMIYINRSR